MASNIFLIDQQNKLLELRRADYDTEEILQTLIADHPALLGAPVGGDHSLLLVQREQAVPDQQYGSGRWALDHLFLDRNGVPILVEVKRATDTRARREVVAQMLDYAANGVAYWPIEGIIASFRKSTENAGEDPDAKLAKFLGEGDPDSFWKSVEANLRSGRVRMVFLADEIGKELRRIVEFLNEQMRPAEVLAVEVVQYLNPNGIRTLVPQLVGATERARALKSSVPQKEPIEESEWLTSLEETKGAEARQGAQKAIEWLRSLGLDVAPTKSQDALCARFVLPDGRSAWPFFIRRSSGRIELSLGNIMNSTAFREEEARMRLLDRMKDQLPGVSISTTKANGWPSVPLQRLLDDSVWLPMMAIMNDVCEELRS